MVNYNKEINKIGKKEREFLTLFKKSRDSTEKEMNLIEIMGVIKKSEDKKLIWRYTELLYIFTEVVLFLKKIGIIEEFRNTLFEEIRDYFDELVGIFIIGGSRNGRRASKE